MFSTANQAYIFLSTVYAGFAIGFIYDLYRVVRRITKPGRIITALMDLLFWLVIGVLSFLVIFYVNDGDVRVYTIAGFAIGWALYALALSPVVMKVLIFVYTAIAKAISWIIGIILWPFRMLIKGIGYPVRWLRAMFLKLKEMARNRAALRALKKRMKMEGHKEDF